MKIYTISPLVEQYKQLTDDEPESMSQARFKELTFDGESKTANWRPMTLRWIQGSDTEGSRRETYDKSYEIPDIAHWVMGCLVLSPKATDILRPIFNDLVEFLPVEVGRESWTILNVINTQNAVKEILKADGGLTRWFDEIVFDHEKLTDAKLFKVTQSHTRTFTSDMPGSFKEIVESHRLTGLEFDEY